MTEKNANNSLWGFGDTGETIKYEPVTELWVFTDQTPHKEAWLLTTQKCPFRAPQNKCRREPYKMTSKSWWRYTGLIGKLLWEHKRTGKGLFLIYVYVCLRGCVWGVTNKSEKKKKEEETVDGQLVFSHECNTASSKPFAVLLATSLWWVHLLASSTPLIPMPLSFCQFSNKPQYLFATEVMNKNPPHYRRKRSYTGHYRWHYKRNEIITIHYAIIIHYGTLGLLQHSQGDLGSFIGSNCVEHLSLMLLTIILWTAQGIVHNPLCMCV